MKYTIIHVNDRARDCMDHNNHILSTFERVDDIEFFDGRTGDGRASLEYLGINTDAWKPYDHRNWNPLPAEYGIWVTTVNCLQYIVDNELDELLVLEDDILLSDSFIENFLVYVSELPRNYDYLSLSHLENQNICDDLSDIGLKHIHKSVNQPAGAQAILYSNKGATTILDYMRSFGMEYTSDCFIHRLSARGLIAGYSLKPDSLPIIFNPQNSIESIIDPLNRRLTATGDPLKIFYGDDSASHLSSLFLDIQQILNPNISIEVGAHSAEFSQQIISRHPQITSWAFEANKNVYDLYCSNVRSHGIKYLNIAVSDDFGMREFKVSTFHNDEKIDPTVGYNSLYEKLESGWEYLTESVESVSLDGFFIENQAVAINDRVCLWIDVEGASREVLLGAKDILSITQSIFIEVEHKTHWVNQWLFSDVDTFLYSSGFIAIARDNEYGSIGQNNVIYIKRNIEWFDEIMDLLK